MVKIGLVVLVLLKVLSGWCYGDPSTNLVTRPNYQAVAAVRDTALLSQESLSVVTGSPVIEVQPLQSTKFKHEA